jgi:hypothetical protein
VKRIVLRHANGLHRILSGVHAQVPPVIAHAFRCVDGTGAQVGPVVAGARVIREHPRYFLVEELVLPQGVSQDDPLRAS